MADQWYYTQAGARQGPVSPQELQQLATSGQLQPEDLIWKDGMPDWVAANTIPNLFGPPQASQTPPPPPPPPMRAAVRQGNFFEQLGLDGILLGSGALVVALGCILPWYSVSAGVIGASAIGFRFWEGVLSFLGAVGVGVCTAVYYFVPEVQAKRDRAKIFQIVFTAVGGVIVLVSFIFLLRADSLSAGGVEAGFSVGVFITMIGAGSIITAGVRLLRGG